MIAAWAMHGSSMQSLPGSLLRPEELPENKDSPQVCGKTANGCRLAFDLGKSDIKTVAVKDGEAPLHARVGRFRTTCPNLSSCGHGS